MVVIIKCKNSTLKDIQYRYPEGACPLKRLFGNTLDLGLMLIKKKSHVVLWHSLQSNITDLFRHRIGHP